MPVVPVGATSNNNGATSTFSVAVAPHASAQVGDLALVVACNERGSSVSPSVAAPTAGYTVGYLIGQANIAVGMGWKRLTAGDLGQLFTASFSSIRRGAIAVLVLRGAADPEWPSGANGAYNSSATAHTSPSVTPTVADSMLVALSGLVCVFDPINRTFSPSAGWTEDAEDSTTAANGSGSMNAVIEIAHKLLSGGVSLQTGVTLTPSDITTNTVSYRSTVVVAPAPNVAPTVSVTGNQNVAAAATVNLAATPDDVDGSIVSTVWTYDYPVSGGPALTGGTTTTPSFTAGSAGALYVLRCTVTDDQGGTGFATTEVRVPTTGELVPLAAYGGSGVAVTNTGGAASEEAALADASDATYLLFGAATSTVVERRWRLKPSAVRASGTLTPKTALDTAGTFVGKVRLYQGATLKKEWTLTTPTTTLANEALALSSAEAATISDWGNLWAATVQSTV